MDQATSNLKVRYEFDAAVLFTKHPPVLRHPHKRTIQSIACPPGLTPSGVVTFSRWVEFPLPVNVPPVSAPQITSRPCIYDYRVTDTIPHAVDWHVNFADPELFVAYGSPLFAQDEIQVAEHPVLGSIREALRTLGDDAATVDGLRPTPVLIRGVERRVIVAINVNRPLGRPRGLYGNDFATAPDYAIIDACTRVDPPTLSNILAIAAPSPAHGHYTRDQISYILRAAYSGFTAARIESREVAGPNAATIIHTGFWGCGAFGGNRTMMLTLQIAAASLAGIHSLVFYTVDPAGQSSFNTALDVWHRHFSARPVSSSSSAIIETALGLRLSWGQSDGN